MDKLDFRKLSTIGLILGGIATMAQIISLPLPYVIGVGLASLVVLIYGFIVRRRVRRLPEIPAPQENSVSVRNIVTPAEFEDLDKLYHLCFGSSSVPTEVLKSWWTAHPRGLLGLFKNGEVIGGVSIWSIDDETFNKIKNGFIKEREILYNNIDNSSCDKYYVSEIAITNKERNMFNLSELLQGVIEHLKDISCYPTSILALGYSPQGINLMKRFGFIKQLNADKTPDKQPLFLLSIESKDDMQKLLENLEKLQNIKA